MWFKPTSSPNYCAALPRPVLDFYFPCRPLRGRGFGSQSVGRTVGQFLSSMLLPYPIRYCLFSSLEVDVTRTRSWRCPHGPRVVSTKRLKLHDSSFLSTFYHHPFFLFPCFIYIFLEGSCSFTGSLVLAKSVR